MAPDSQVATDGQRLGRVADWVSLGADEAAIWGEIRGSGSKPYRVSVDMGDGASKCSCPSRKFPCKHAIGRMLVHVASPQSAKGDRPEWTESWLAARSRAATAKASDKPVDEKAQAKRRQARVSKVEGGMAEFGLWMRDMAARGLAATAREDFGYWDRMAARLVDAQAPVLARRLRAAAALSSQPAAERDALANEIGRLWTVCRAWERREHLPPPLLGSLRAVVGFPPDGNGTPVTDTWNVLGQRFEEDDGLKSRTTWLCSVLGGDIMAAVDHAVAGQGHGHIASVGRAFEGTILMQPGIHGRRAVVDNVVRETAVKGFEAARSLPEAMDAVAETVGMAPWIADVPACIRDVRFGRLDGGPALGDGGACIPLADVPGVDSYAAASRGHPVSVFGTWDGMRLRVLSMSTGDGMFTVRDGADYAEKVA